MRLFFQLVFDGLAMGMVYVLLAAGNVLICSVNKIIMVSYGMFYTIGAYFTWYLSEHTALPYGVIVLLSTFGAAMVGVIAYVLTLQKHQLKITQGGFLATMIVSMGLQIVLNQLILIVFGTEPHSVSSVFPGKLKIMGVSITYDKVLMIVVGVVVTILLFFIFKKTRFGRAMRAVALDPYAASLQGIRANRVYCLTLALACAVAGLAGCILAPSFGIESSMGSNVIWTVMLMTMLGGRDSLPGAVIGGLVIGELLAFGQYFIGGFIQVIVFLVIGVILYFRPNGLLGHHIEIGI